MALAERHAIEPSRVLALHQRTVQEVADLELGVGFEGFVRARFTAAVEQLGGDRALALFERERLLPMLVFRDGIPQYLAHPEAPLYSLEELATTIEGFVAHQRQEHDALLRTGFPNAAYAASPWLELHLGKLYPVIAAPAIERAGHEGAQAYRYPWGAPGSDRPAAPNWNTPDASALPGLSAEDSLRLQSTRPLMLDLKLAVLACLAQAIREQATDAASRVLAILDSAISRQDADFWRQQDRLYRPGGYSLAEDLAFECVPGFRLIPYGLPGGLSDLLRIVGHAITEIKDGRLAWTKTQLVGIAARHGLPSWRDSVSGTYIACAAAAWGTELNNVLDVLFLYPFHGDHIAFHKGMEARLDRFFGTELKDLLRIENKIAPGHLARLEAYVRPLVAFAGVHLEATGSLPTLFVADAASAASDPAEPEFRRDGDHWIVVFDGKRSAIRDSVGMRHIAFLLANPNRDILVMDLAQRSRAPGLRAMPATGENLRAPGNTLRANSSTGDSGRVIDGRTEADLRRAMAEIERELASGGLDGDQASQQRTKLAGIQSYLHKATGIGGRHRRLGDDGERARKTVASAMRAALTKISATNPTLADHLRANITTGRYCKYHPAKPFRWNL